MEQNIYADIANRTQGDIYVGVVGPVRTGKSTFISSFMSALVVPKMTNKSLKQRTIDELPQSANGTTIMTMQPKFVPEVAINVELEKGVSASLRLIDCVGYLIDGAGGATENGKPRMVKTPWSETPMEFEKAAEIGTQKVALEHSTICVVVTTDGTIGDIPRSSYIDAENRAITELKACKKPFVVVVNSVNPDGELASEIVGSIKEKYDAQAVALNVAKMTEANVLDLFQKVLYEFPMKRVDIDLPDWAKALDMGSSLIVEIMQNVAEISKKITKVGDFSKIFNGFASNTSVENVKLENLNLGNGVAKFALEINKKVFYEMLSEKCGELIDGDFALMKYLKNVAYAKREYAKLENALNSVKDTGYGVVLPTCDDLILEEPEIVKKGNASVVKLKAKASSLHIMRVDVETEIMPQMNGETNSEDLASYLVREFENDPKGIWKTNMFGKPLSVLAGDGISNKLMNLPNEAKVKMGKTLTKIVNENKGGIICILL